MVVIDLDYNRISTTEEIPSIPEPELSFLRGEIMKLLYPNVIEIDLIKGNGEGTFGRSLRGVNKPWSKDHDLQLRY